MTITDFELVQAIVKYGSITKASEMLFISRPTISLRLRNIETKLGIILFKRAKGQKVTVLTEEGLAIMPYINDIMENWQMIIDITNNRAPIELRIAVGQGHLRQFGKVVNFFKTQHPKIKLHLEVRHYKEAIEMIEKESLDICITAERYYSNCVDCQRIGTEPMILICGSKCSFSSFETVGLDDLDVDFELVWYMEPCEISNWHNKYLKKRALQSLPDSIHMLEDFIFNSPFWAIVPLSHAKRILNASTGVVIKHVNFELPSRNIYLIIRKNFSKTEQIDYFIRIIKEIFKETLDIVDDKLC